MSDVAPKQRPTISAADYLAIKDPRQRHNTAVKSQMTKEELAKLEHESPVEAKNFIAVGGKEAV